MDDVMTELNAAHSNVAKVKIACEAFGIPASSGGKAKTRNNVRSHSDVSRAVSLTAEPAKSTRLKW